MPERCAISSKSGCILVRWDIREDTYFAMLHFTCGITAWRALGPTEIGSLHLRHDNQPSRAPRGTFDYFVAWYSNAPMSVFDIPSPFPSTERGIPRKS